MLASFEQLRKSAAFPDVIIGLAMVIMASAMALATSMIKVSPGYAYVGPRTFPYAVSIFLGLVGAGLALAAFMNVASERITDTSGADVRTERYTPAMVWVVGGLAANLIGLYLLGFVFAAVIQYVLTARGFGSRNWGRDALCGLALACAAYFLFSVVLKVNIPAGPALELLSQWII